MTDPYKVLGVPSSATDEQVKAAYRELAKKYHPDNYANNPLSDLAQEKMQEINEAYDAIVTQRKAGGSTGSPRSGYQSAQTPSQFSDIRRLINSGRLAEAQELLDGVSSSSRDAEWYFLRGTIYYNHGWLDDALKHFGQAHSINPQNQEYTAAYNQMLWQRQTGRAYQGSPYQQRSSGSDCSCCDICTALYCANCCMGCCDGGCF